MKLTAKIQGVLMHAGFQKYLANTSWLLFGRIFTLVISFWVMVYVARYLGPTNFGTLSYAVGFVGFFSFIANLGIDQILYRELVKNPNNANQLLGSSLVLKLIAGTIAYVLAVTLTFVIDRDIFISSLIAIIGLSFFFQPLQIINFYFQSRVEAKKTILTQIVVISLLSVSKLAIIFYGLGIYYFSAIFLLESILYAIFYCFAYFKTTKNFSWSFSFNMAKMILLTSWPYMLTTAFAIIYTRIDQLMIKHFIDTTSVGIYDAAVRISEIWYFIPGAIISSLFPAIINAKLLNNGSYEKRLVHFFTFIIAISSFVAIPIFLFSTQIITILYGISYTGAADVLRVYVLGGIAYSFSLAITQYLSAEHNEKIIFFSAFTGMVVNVLLNIIWIPYFGIIGAAWATLIAYTTLPLSILISKKVRAHLKIIVRSYRTK